MSATDLLEVPVMSLQVTAWLAPFCAMLWVQSARMGSSRHHVLCLCLKLSWRSPGGQEGLQ